MQMSVMLLILISLLLSPTTSTPCTTNMDCSTTPESGGWGCCSGYGFCVGPNSGWKCSGKLATLGNPSGSCYEDGDCPGVEGGGVRCCGDWGWCTDKC